MLIRGAGPASHITRQPILFRGDRIIHPVAALYEFLFSNSKDAVYVADPDDRFVCLNPAAMTLFKRCNNDQIPRNVRNLFESPFIYQQFKTELKTNECVKDFEFRLKQEDNRIIECLLTAGPIRDPQESKTGHQGMIRDITSQKEAKQKIREQNKLLTNILESLTHPFVVIDTADYSIKIANSAALNSQISEQHTCHKHCYHVRQNCPYGGYTCALEEVVTSGIPYHTEHLRFNKAGEQRKYEVHSFPRFNESGHIVQVIQYHLDITEKKRLESIAEAASLMDNLGYIFSGIRHEIGNPLNSVKMALSVLSKNLDSYDRKTTQEFIARSLSELSRVEYLLKALKNFSLFESPHIESVNIRNFMHNFFSLIQNDFKKKQIHLAVEIAPNTVHLNTDHRALHQVLLNLVTNSADALANRKTPEIRIAITRESRWIKIQVIDNGCGILKEEIQKIFNPFVTSKPHGTGLGLVIVKKMVAMMDGSIKVRSRKDQGTTITLIFPEGDHIDM